MYTCVYGIFYVPLQMIRIVDIYILVGVADLCSGSEAELRVGQADPTPIAALLERTIVRRRGNREYAYARTEFDRRHKHHQLVRPKGFLQQSCENRDLAKGAKYRELHTYAQRRAGSWRPQGTPPQARNIIVDVYALHRARGLGIAEATDG